MRSSSRIRRRPLAAAPLLPVVVALLIAPLPVAFGHGGSFRGPNGAVPPGLREPHDPEPPPPPPSDPTPDGPVTGVPDPQGPVTRPEEHGPESGGGTPQPPTPGQPGGGRGRTTRIGYDSWRFWWAYNNDEILNLRRVDRGVITVSDPIAAGKGDVENRRDALRATRREIERSVLPALLACIERKDEHEDVHGGAVIAAAKVGSGRLIPLFEAVLRNRFENQRGERVDFGPQARESAVLALGLIPDLEDGARAEVRRILLDVIADGTFRTRERAWAAVALGLRRDADATRPLLALLPLRYPDDNVPAGIVVGLGLAGDNAVRPALEEIFLRGTLDGKDLSPRVRPFAGYALGKLGDPAGLPALLRALASRRTGMLERRSAALAAGALGERAAAADRAEAVETLLRTVRAAGADATTRNFALVSLGRIGTEPALVALLEEAENGPAGSRAYAALGLATRVWYSAQANPLDEALRRRIVRKLADVSARLRDAETRAAFLLSRGLVKDAEAFDELVQTVARPGDTTLRGFACVGLGLLGDARPLAKDALRAALDERTNVDLRRDAATGLGLLRDADTVPYLLDQLRAAQSFAVQGQLVAAIGAIGDRRALQPLVTLLEDRSQTAQVRALAAVGLGLIGDPRPVPALARLSRDYNYRASVPDLDELLYIF